MTGTLQAFESAGRKCACFCPSGEGPFPLAVLCGWNMESLLPALARELPPMLLVSAEADGDRDFTPWPTPGIREGEAFTGQAEAYLAFLTAELLPGLESRYPLCGGRGQRALLGYSLGGLFALWAAMECGQFGLAASLSGSLWYEGWMEYLKSRRLPEGTGMYLSLGDREEFGGPPRMRAVGDCTRETASFLSRGLADVTLEWNRGGHARGVESRWLKALRWAAKRMDENGKGGELP